MNYDYNTYEEAIDAIDGAARNAEYESGGEVGYEDAAHDITIALFRDMAPQVAADVARCFIGWDPWDDQDLYERHGVNPELAK